MPETRLNKKQISFFRTFGFLHFPGLLNDCIDRITDEFELIWKSHGGGHNGQPHDAKKRSCIVPFPDQSEYLSRLLDDPRIHDIVASLCGNDFNYFTGDGNLYTSDTGWHSDGFIRNRILSIKMAFYLDPSTRDTGALRVIPGSHLDGDAYAETVEEQVRESESHWDITGAHVPSVALETVPGDVVVFNHNLKHAAFGGSGRRRMFTMNFSQRYPED